MSPWKTHPVDQNRIAAARQQIVYRDARYNIAAGEVIDKLLSAGCEVYAAGGAPRDWLDRKEARDLDIYVDRELTAVRQVLRQAYPGIDPVHRPRPDGCLLRWGNSPGGELDISYLRSYRDIRQQDMWTTQFPPRSDLKEDALLRDFSVNAFYYDFRHHRLLDPLDCGLDDLEKRILRLIAHPAVLDGSFRTTLRIGLFFCRGYTAANNVLEYLELCADRDILGMNQRLRRWLPNNLSADGPDLKQFQKALEPWLHQKEARSLLQQALTEIATAKA